MPGLVKRSRQYTRAVKSKIDPPKGFHTYKVPNKCPAVVKLIFHKLNEHWISADRFEKDTGLCFHAVGSWRRNVSPVYHNLEAALNYVGYTLIAVPLEEEDYGGLHTREQLR